MRLVEDEANFKVALGHFDLGCNLNRNQTCLILFPHTRDPYFKTKHNSQID